VSTVQHGAFDAWERPRDDLRRRAMAAADVDERVQPAEKAALVENNDLHEELAIRDQGVVQDGVERGILARHLPPGAAVRQLEEGPDRRLAPEPVGHAVEGGDDEGARHERHHRGQVAAADEEPARRGEPVHGVTTGAATVFSGGGDGEDARSAEQLHHALEVWHLGRVHLGVGCDVGEGGCPAAAVDGVGDVEIHSALERHGLHVAKEVGLELGKSYEQVLWAHLGQEPKRHAGTFT